METPQDLPSGTTNVEQDPLSSTKKYWMRGSEEGGWFRLWWKSDKPEIRSSESLHLSPVRVEEFRQKQRGAVALLLGRKPEFNELHIPGETRHIALRIQQARDALLAWSKKPEMPLDLSELARNTKAGSDIRSLQNGMALVFEGEDGKEAETSKETDSPIAAVPDSPTAIPLSENKTGMRTEMQALGNRILEAVKDLGEVVADLQPESATRLCLLLKHTHFAQGVAQDIKRSPTSLLTRLQHEHALYLIQHRISDITGLDRIHLFYEGLVRESGVWEQECKKIQAQPNIEAFQEQYRRNPSAPFGDPAENNRRILSLLQQGKDQQAEIALYLLGGTESFAIWCARRGDTLEGRVHGLSDSVQNAAFLQELQAFQQSMRKVMREDPAKYQSLFDQFCCEKRMKQCHSCIVEQFQNHIRQGEVGILPLGADHVREGFHQTHSIDPFRGYQLEDYIEKCPELRDLRIIVIEPNGFLQLNNLR